MQTNIEIYKGQIMNQTLEDLKVKLAEKQAENKARLSTMIEAKKIELEINKLDSEFFTKQTLIQSDIDNLNTIIKLIEEKQAKHEKKLRRTFGLGEIPSLILTIATNVMYAKMDDREELYIASKLNSVLVEMLVESIGRPAYFNAKDLVVEPAIEYDIEKARTSIKLAYIAMGLVSEPDLSKLTEDNFSRRFKAAQLQAEELQANTLKYIDSDETVEYE